MKAGRLFAQSAVFLNVDKGPTPISPARLHQFLNPDGRLEFLPRGWLGRDGSSLSAEFRSVRLGLAFRVALEFCADKILSGRRAYLHYMP